MDWRGRDGGGSRQARPVPIMIEPLKPNLSPDDLVTNEFIGPSIELG